MAAAEIRDSGQPFDCLAFSRFGGRGQFHGKEQWEKRSPKPHRHARSILGSVASSGCARAAVLHFPTRCCI
jgi:hypothetical protein